MSDDLYALWLTWGTPGYAQEWAALMMESCPRTEENQPDERVLEKEFRDGPESPV